VDARELADLISSPDAVPASGWVAGVTAALGAALVAKVAARSDGWSGAAGARAQAADLRDRLLDLAAEDAHAYESALSALETPGAELAEALAVSAEVPLAIAEASAAECADGPVRPDAAAAAALAAGAARAAAKLIAVNLATTPGDERLAAADRALETAEDAARAAFVSDM
jgi:methenyltetrahydrofolate cyclohydrolase